MGRTRKPLEMQKGNITQLVQYVRGAEEKQIVTGKNQLSRPPDWLIDEVAISEYKRIIKEMKKIEIIGNLDRNNVACYCNAFANYVKITQDLKNEPGVLMRETRTGAIVVRNPKIDLQRMYADEMRKFASLCGLTIDSRLKAAANKTSKQEDETKEQFGI